MKKEIIKPFDLAKAKAGAKLRTRGGYPVEIFKWDARGDYPIVGIIKKEEADATTCWCCRGSYYGTGIPHPYDLFIVEEVEEPKFKVGDWITNDVNVVKVQNIKEDFYICESTTGGEWDISIKDIKINYHLWTAEDAKAGDMLTYGSWIFIVKSISENGFSYFAILGNTGFYINSEASTAAEHTITPATKDQRELLFSKMKDEGYEWNADKLKLKKIEPKFWSDNKSNTFEGFFIGTYGDIIEVLKLSNTVSNYNIFATKKQAKSAFAMARISQIMANDIENFGGVVTDEEWKNLDFKYVIDRYDDRINTVEVRSVYHFLAFHTKKQRDLFLEKYPQLVRDFLMIPDEETK